MASSSKSVGGKPDLAASDVFGSSEERKKYPKSKHKKRRKHKYSSSDGEESSDSAPKHKKKKKKRRKHSSSESDSSDSDHYKRKRHKKRRHRRRSHDSTESESESEDSDEYRHKRRKKKRNKHKRRHSSDESSDHDSNDHSHRKKAKRRGSGKAKEKTSVGVLGAISPESDLKLEAQMAQIRQQLNHEKDSFMVMELKKRLQHANKLNFELAEEKDKQLQEHKQQINQLNRKKDAFIMELQKQVQNANKLNFQLTDKYSIMTQAIDKYASEMQELRREIQNIANRNKQSVTAKEKTIMHLQDDIVGKNAEISQLMQAVTTLRTLNKILLGVEPEEETIVEEATISDEPEEETMVEEATISDKLDPAMEEEVFQHRPVKAWRYDSEQKKWRGRGKGQLTIYLHHEKEIAKIVFMDEKHDKVRLLQWIDGDTHCKVSPEDGDKKEVEWYGADYTMDLKDPMSGQWKLCFLDDETAAQGFMDVFNRCIDDAMATRSMNSEETKEDNDDNDEDKASESSTKPFSFEVIDKKKPESFVNDESLTFNPFKQSDATDAGANNASGSFANTNWDFQPPPNVDNETADDNGLKRTFKPIVQLEEQKVDTGHEEETLIIEIPFLKLYRFGNDVAQMPCWKIRASKSAVFFYKSNANGKIRMVAREQETSKLRMNQFVPKSEDATFNTKQANIYQWQAYDSSIAAEEEDENAGFTNWCIKFGDTLDANTFETEFKKAVQVNDSISGATNDDNNNETISNLSNEVEPTQNHVNEATDANDNEQAEDERYKGWTQKEIAADKLRQERVKQGQEAAKLFQGSTDANANPQTTWEMPGDLFSANKADNPIPDVFSGYDFESQRGVDLEAEKVMNRIQTDASISFGVSGNHADESSNVVHDFSNVTSRDNAEDDTTAIAKENEVEVEKPQSGLSLSNFAFDAPTEEVTASTWGDGSGGFSSVEPTDGFANVDWASNDGNGFGSFAEWIADNKRENQAMQVNDDNNNETATIETEIQKP